MRLLALFIGTLLLLASCDSYKYDKLFPGTVLCDTASISYSKDIQPIIAANCAVPGCHDAAGSQISGHDYTGYAGVQAVASHDFIITDIEGTPIAGHSSMPKNRAKLPDCNIEKIVRWVNEGAPNN